MKISDVVKYMSEKIIERRKPVRILTKCENTINNILESICILDIYILCLYSFSNILYDIVNYIYISVYNITRIYSSNIILLYFIFIIIYCCNDEIIFNRIQIFK